MSEMQEQEWKIIISALGTVGTAGGFLYWHFKTVNGFKDEIHRIDLKNRDLEHNDKMQQAEMKENRDFYNGVVDKIKLKNYEDGN